MSEHANDDVWRGWSVMGQDGTLFRSVFQTRRELIFYECWNLGEVKAPDTRSLKPWLRCDPDEVSKAWRRLKSKRGLRAVSVLVQVASWEAAR